MNIPLSKAKAKLLDLVRRAEAGDEVVLTRHGQPVVRLVALGGIPNAAARGAALERFQARASKKIRPGPDAARSQDFLYDADGLPA